MNPECVAIKFKNTCQLIFQNGPQGSNIAADGSQLYMKGEWVCGMLASHSKESLWWKQRRTLQFTLNISYYFHTPQMPYQFLNLCIMRILKTLEMWNCIILPILCLARFVCCRHFLTTLTNVLSTCSIYWFWQTPPRQFLSFRLVTQLDSIPGTKNMQNSQTCITFPAWSNHPTAPWVQHWPCGWKQHKSAPDFKAILELEMNKQL